jgi:hypothetical protein
MKTGNHDKAQQNKTKITSSFLNFFLYTEPMEILWDALGADGCPLSTPCTITVVCRLEFEVEN